MFKLPQSIRWTYPSIAFSFAVLYVLISFVNHYMFRTYALDLGLYTNSMYQYLHGSLAMNGMIATSDQLALSDHFDLYLILFSPLLLLLGTHTLLVVQIAAILFGGYGVYRFFERSAVGAWATVFFYSFFGVFSAVSFDYHSNVVSAAVIPWLFYCVKKERFRMAAVVLVFILVGKENISLWMFFVCAGMALLYQSNRRKVIASVLFGVVSIVYFLVIIGWVMPMLSGEGSYSHFDYSVLGGSMPTALSFVFRHPMDSFQLLFDNHSGDPFWDDVKFKTHFLLILSGVFFLIRRPVFLLMIIPIYFQKFYHDNIMV